LRDTAAWIPRTPRASLVFDHHAESLDSDLLCFRPLTWLDFGGPAGIYLPNIIGISVSVFDWSTIFGISFRYNTKVDGRLVHTLGKEPPFYSPVERFPVGMGGDHAEVMDIDGPGGERITTVDINVFSPDEAIMDAFRISTNRGRSMQFPKHPLSNGQWLNIFTEKDTTATGFYSQLVSRY
jgi:hypothetical protein